MTKIILDETKFTDTAKETLDKFIYYTDGVNPITLISDSCAVVLPASLKDQESIIKATDEKTEEALNSMPDFRTYIMDDENGLVILVNGDVFVFVKEEHLRGFESMPIEVALEYRGKGLDACEAHDRIALYIPDENVTD